MVENPLIDLEEVVQVVGPQGFRVDPNDPRPEGQSRGVSFRPA
jgi:hypothetical protein